MTDTTKTSEKQNEKPTEERRYAIARFPVGRDAEFVKEMTQANGLADVTITTDRTEALTFQAKMGAWSVIQYLDDTWTIVRV